ncbi:MAG: hypothetical protein L0Y39_03300 [Methylococcaceae bacterium]|nr:hypothetical protein [Methylococcaceae bacterium]
MDRSINTVKSVRPYCGGGCSIGMKVAGNRVIKATGDKQHPANFGRICANGNTCAQAIAESGRLDHAHLRTDRRREPARVDIDHAIQETARRLRADTHDPDSLAF